MFQYSHANWKYNDIGIKDQPIKIKTHHPNQHLQMSNSLGEDHNKVNSHEEFNLFCYLLVQRECYNSHNVQVHKCDKRKTTSNPTHHIAIISQVHRKYHMNMQPIIFHQALLYF
jgi:hypothetical protein